MSSAGPETPLRRLLALGQSPWLDFIDRGLIATGELERLVDWEGVRGVTSNPSIFQRAIAGGAYDTTIREAPPHLNAEEVYERLALADVAAAADVLRPVHEKSQGRDGFVSLEVSPRLARDTRATIEAGRRLCRRLDRPNVMIKVPATEEGLPAIRRLIAEGVHVNVTLLFDPGRYRLVVQAHQQGLLDRSHRGLPLDEVASVASFFVSRIDGLFDRELAAVAVGGGQRACRAQRLVGQVAIASAKRAYAIFEVAFGAGGPFAALATAGARRQRLLWASTAPKDPSYPDTKYVEALVGPETVVTLPLETLRAYADHGDPSPRLTGSGTSHEAVLHGARELGIDLEGGAERLLGEGLRKFADSYDGLLAAIEEKRSAHGAGRGA